VRLSGNSRQVIQQLMQHRNVRRPYLGIKFVSEAHPASSQPRVPGEVHQKVTVLEVAPG
jgi:S1-C subfamily serine protease